MRTVLLVGSSSNCASSTAMISLTICPIHDGLNLPRFWQQRSTFLVPAARTFSISATNMAGIRARAVVPVANAPCTEDAFRTLHGRGVLCLPGFVTNSGGVFASGLHDSGVSTAEIERIGVEFYRPVVAALLQRAGREGVSPVSLAERIALQRFERNSGSNEPGGYGEKLLRKLRQRGVVPRPLEGRRTAARFVDNLRQLFVEVQGY